MSGQAPQARILARASRLRAGAIRFQNELYPFETSAPFCSAASGKRATCRGSVSRGLWKPERGPAWRTTGPKRSMRPAAVRVARLHGPAGRREGAEEHRYLDSVVAGHGDADLVDGVRQRRAHDVHGGAVAGGGFLDQVDLGRGGLCGGPGRGGQEHRWGDGGLQGARGPGGSPWCAVFGRVCGIAAGWSTGAVSRRTRPGAARPSSRRGAGCGSRVPGVRCVRRARGGALRRSR